MYRPKYMYMCDVFYIVHLPNTDGGQILADILQKRVKAPAMFVHEDLHAGKVTKRHDREYVLFDWDSSRIDIPLLDVVQFALTGRYQIRRTYAEI